MGIWLCVFDKQTKTQTLNTEPEFYQYLFLFERSDRFNLTWKWRQKNLLQLNMFK